MRDNSGVKKVASGFAVGFAIEFLVLSTTGLIYIGYYPLVKLMRGSLPASVIGHLIAKLSLLPVILLPVAKTLGGIFHLPKIPMSPNFNSQDVKALSILLHTIIRILNAQMEVLVGMLFLSPIFGLVSYYGITFLYETNRKVRLKKRKAKTKSH